VTARLLVERSEKRIFPKFLAEKHDFIYGSPMERTSSAGIFEGQGFRATPRLCVSPGKGGMKIFPAAQASQPVEIVDSARENPRKSKPNDLLFEVDSGSERSPTLKSNPDSAPRRRIGWRDPAARVSTMRSPTFMFS
jgi:hypothetical protein